MDRSRILRRDSTERDLLSKTKLVICDVVSAGGWLDIADPSVIGSPRVCGVLYLDFICTTAVGAVLYFTWTLNSDRCGHRRDSQSRRLGYACIRVQYFYMDRK